MPSLFLEVVTPSFEVTVQSQSECTTNLPLPPAAGSQASAGVIVFAHAAAWRTLGTASRPKALNAAAKRKRKRARRICCISISDNIRS